MNACIHACDEGAFASLHCTHGADCTSSWTADFGHVYDCTGYTGRHRMIGSDSILLNTARQRRNVLDRHLAYHSRPSQYSRQALRRRRGNIIDEEGRIIMFIVSYFYWMWLSSTFCCSTVDFYFAKPDYYA